MSLTPAELAILGLVVERPSHGYDLERVIEQRGIREWTDIGFSSIYYLLRVLEKRGLVQGSESGPGPKGRRVFHATMEGSDLAASEARAFIAEAGAVAHTLMVGLANLPLLAEGDYVQALGTRLVQIEGRIAAVEEAQRSQISPTLAARELFSYSLSLLTAERSWLAARVQVGDD